MSERFFPPQFLDQLRSRVAPSMVIRNFTDLRQKPGGEYMGLCPFHSEKTPSFTVSDDKGFYHCFGCGAHGDIFRFLTEHKGLKFAEAVTLLAEQAGLPLPVMDEAERRKLEVQQTLYDVCEAACRFYEEQLQLTTGEEARRYLQRRKVSAQSIKTFRIGYAPDKWDALKANLLQKGITEQQLIDAGLIAVKAGQPSYDRFRHRILFPICDTRGRVIAFGGRSLGDQEPKYLNSPETPLFHKGHHFYAQHFARSEAYTQKKLLIVEGYLDVVTLHQFGFRYAVAPLGTAVTESQIQLAWNMADEPILCMDGDAAGKRAMDRALALALPQLKPGKSLSFASVRGGKDPDELLHEAGAAPMQAILDQAIPLSEALWSSLLEQYQPATPEQWAQFEQALNASAEKIQDATVRRNYQGFLKDKLWNERKERRIQAQQPQKKRSSAGISPHKTVMPPLRKTAGIEEFSEMLLVLVLKNPSLAEDSDIHAVLETLELSDADAMRAVDMILSQTSLEEGYNALEARYPGTAARAYPSAEIARNAWKYLYGMVQWMQMEEEYRQRSAKISAIGGDEMETVWELKKQKDTLKLLAEQAKIAYEAVVQE